ncbi:MAG: LuxR C-terminal-related transcriptional regulator [Flammeovirgaceae bacterium]
MTETDFYSHLYQIASQLNREFSLHAVLRSALEKTVQLLHLKTGWIWLTQENAKSVYLAASYNLPPALSKHPERLSGYCYCIQKYFADDLEKASNISEITCTRLKDLKSGTLDLMFHATIPISINNQKIGLLNLLSEKSQQLSSKQLSILNFISELIATAVHRSRTRTSYTDTHNSTDNLKSILERILMPKVNELAKQLHRAKHYVSKQDFDHTQNSLEASLHETQAIQQQLALILEATEENLDQESTGHEFQYPFSPLTNRELEVLALVKKGNTNKQIADYLFISERTVKFHMTSLLAKLQAKTRTEAVDLAIKRGLIGI